VIVYKNSNKAAVILAVVIAVSAAVFSAAFFNGTGRSFDRSAELRAESEAEYRQLESSLRRATATIDEIERGLGRIERIASEIEFDNEGAVGAIRTAIEIVERVRLEVAALEGSIADFRVHNGGVDYTLEP
jgi:hypothetical protein